MTAAEATMLCQCFGHINFRNVADIGALRAGAAVRTCALAFQMFGCAKLNAGSQYIHLDKYIYIYMYIIYIYMYIHMP